MKPFSTFSESTVLLFHRQRRQLVFCGEDNIRSCRISEDLFEPMLDLCLIEWNDGKMDEVAVGNDYDKKTLADFQELILNAANKAGDLSLCEDEDWRYEVVGNGNFMIEDINPDSYLTDASGNDIISVRDWNSGEGVADFDGEYDTFYTRRANELSEEEAKAVLYDANIMFAPDSPTQMNAITAALMSEQYDLVVDLAKKSIRNEDSTKEEWIELFPELEPELEEE